MRVLALTFMTFCLVGCGASTAGSEGGAPALVGTGGQGGDAALVGTGGEGGDAALVGTGGQGGASPQSFPCEGYWTCGGVDGRVGLMPQADGCLLSGLSGRNLLSPDGTVTADGVIVGKATGFPASVIVAYPDGSQWLFCRRAPM